MESRIFGRVICFLYLTSESGRWKGGSGEKVVPKDGTGGGGGDCFVLSVFYRI
jgi:hypothetical protein